MYPHGNNVETLQFHRFIKILNQINVKSRYKYLIPIAYIVEIQQIYLNFRDFNSQSHNSFSQKFKGNVNS